MNLGEAVSLITGLKIKRPDLYKKYFPIPSDNFISFHTLKYNNFQQVINILFPYLEAYGIKIIHFHVGVDANYKNCLHLNGINECDKFAYFISKSKLHFGENCLLSDLSAILDVKRVIINAVAPDNVADQFFGSKDNECIISNALNHKNNYTYNIDHSEELVNKINPEQIASKILSLLGISHKIPYETLFIGKEHNSRKSIIEVFPDKEFKYSQNGIIYRMDYNFDEQALVNQLSETPIKIYTDKPINHQIISQFKKNIEKFTFEIKSLTDYSHFIKHLKANNVNFELITPANEDDFADLKLQYMDLCRIKQIELRKIKLANLNTYHFSSSKFLIKGQNFYLTLLDLAKNKTIDPGKYSLCSEYDISSLLNHCHVINPSKTT